MLKLNLLQRQDYPISSRQRSLYKSSFSLAICTCRILPKMSFGSCRKKSFYVLYCWESAASDCALELSSAETAICCVPAYSFSFFDLKRWSELFTNCLNLQSTNCVPSKSRLSPVKPLICSQLMLSQIMSSAIFVKSQWTVQRVELSTATLVLLFKSLYLFSLSF